MTRENLTIYIMKDVKEDFRKFKIIAKNLYYHSVSALICEILHSWIKAYLKIQKHDAEPGQRLTWRIVFDGEEK